MYILLRDTVIPHRRTSAPSTVAGIFRTQKGANKVWDKATEANSDPNVSYRVVRQSWYSTAVFFNAIYQFLKRRNERKYNRLVRKYNRLNDRLNNYRHF